MAQETVRRSRGKFLHRLMDAVHMYSGHPKPNHPPGSTPLSFPQLPTTLGDTTGLRPCIGTSRTYPWVSL